jgi:outer membrane protein OmpA-like peptidoglycan-associated protein
VTEYRVRPSPLSNTFRSIDISVFHTEVDMNVRKYSRLVCFALFALLLTGVAGAQDVKARLFAEATAAREAADAKDAVALAPGSYTKAARAYRSAEKKFSEARALERVQHDLDKAAKNFRQAEMVAELARNKLGNMLKARADAQAVSAGQYSARQFKRAEGYFRDAINWNEDGRPRSALKSGEAATELYREAELIAIKTIYLAETEMLILQAEKQAAKRYAPETLAKAKDLLERAEVELTENRYDTDLPRSLAREAKYEARHAIHLAQYLKRAKQAGRSAESLVLEWEAPLQQIAAAADINAEFDKGYEAPVAAVTAYIEDQRAESHELGQLVADGQAEVDALNEEIKELHTELGWAANEQEFLQARLQAQENLRLKVKEIESTFERSEAQVFRDSNEIYIRLVGLNFASGSAALGDAQAVLLGKVEDAIRVFDQSSVIIEGHTDSHGADASNLTLSEQRADAVRTHLIGQMGLSYDQVTAVGYGETRPVANNETPQGRAKNRRIDVRIVPFAGDGANLAATGFSADAAGP